MHKLHVVFNTLYVHDFIAIVRGQQAVAIQNHDNANVHNTGQGEATWQQ
jgi:hypothetical protein